VGPVWRQLRQDFLRYHLALVPACGHLTISTRTNRQLAKNRVSDNVGGVKHFSSTLHHALREERHFALVEGLLFPPKARVVILSGQEISVRPMHLFGPQLGS
jgi:hypothetical protein